MTNNYTASTSEVTRGLPDGHLEADDIGYAVGTTFIPMYISIFFLLLYFFHAVHSLKKNSREHGEIMNEIRTAKAHCKTKHLK